MAGYQSNQRPDSVRQAEAGQGFILRSEQRPFDVSGETVSKPIGELFG